MSNGPLPAPSCGTTRDMFRIGFAGEDDSTAQWDNLQLADVPSRFAGEVVAKLNWSAAYDIEDLLAGLRRISRHRLTLCVPAYDPDIACDGRHGRLSHLIAASKAEGLTLYDLRTDTEDNNRIWLYFVCNEECPYDGERLSLLQSATITIYEHVARYSFLIPLVEGKRVLDIGCGTGLGTAFLSPFVSEIVAVDISAEAVSDAERFRSHAAIRYEHQDILSENIDFGRFDVIICLEMIEHLGVDAQQRLVANMSRWLNDEGYVVCSTPNPDYDGLNPFHAAPLRLPALDALFATVFPHRLRFINAVAMGGIVIPMADAPDTQLLFYDWDEEGQHLQMRAKGDQQQTYFVLVASRSALPPIQGSVSLDVKNNLLNRFELSKRKEALFRSEETRLLTHRLDRMRGKVPPHPESLQQVEMQLRRLQESVTDLEDQLSGYLRHLDEPPSGYLPPQVSPMIESQPDLRQLESVLKTTRQQCRELRAGLMRNEWLRFPRPQPPSPPSPPSSSLLRYSQRVLQGLKSAYKVIFFPIAVPELPRAPIAGDRQPETVERWIHTYERFEARYHELMRLLHQIEHSPRLNRMRVMMRRLRQQKGQALPLPAHHLDVISPRTAPSIADFSDPQITFEHTCRLHQQMTEIARRLERGPARLYRALAPMYRHLQPVGKWWVERLMRRATVPLSEDTAHKRLAARPMVRPKRPMSQGACPVLISIVTPTYNRKALLEKAVVSVLGQSYVNWELIVVDDGSTDATNELQKTYTDPRIRWITQSKQGVCRARNAALNLAQGTYVTFLDSDNIWYPTFLEKMYDSLSQAPDDIAAAYCNAKLYYDVKFVDVMDEHYLPSTMFHRPQIDLNAFMVRRCAVEKAGIFDERMDKWVDYEFMLRLSAHGYFEHVNETLVDYFRLADGITRASASERPMEPNLKIIRETRRNLLKVAYVQCGGSDATSVHREIKALKGMNVDVRVYYRGNISDMLLPVPDVPSYRVQEPDELAALAQQHGVHMLHGCFACPHTTGLLWPAAQKAGIFFSFSGHGAGLQHDRSLSPPKLKAMSQSNLCKVVFVPDADHKQYFITRGVPAAKICVHQPLVDDAETLVTNWCG